MGSQKEKRALQLQSRRPVAASHKGTSGDVKRQLQLYSGQLAKLTSACARPCMPGVLLLPPSVLLSLRAV